MLYNKGYLDDSVSWCCRVQDFKTFGQLKRMLRPKAILRDLSLSLDKI